MSSVLDRVRQLEEKPSDTTSTAEERLDDGVDVPIAEPIKAEQDVEVEEEGQPKVVEEMKVVSEVRSGSEVGEKGAEILTTQPSPPTQIALEPLPEDTHAPDSPTLSLIAALRQQISLLTDQSNELNTKLIHQLERSSDLEDNLDHKRLAEKEKDELIARLEKEKAQWEENMNTGLLVERGTVREEMQRLVEGLVEEEKRRGSAERGREQVEQEIDDLSATLFEQANTMVAAEKYARAQAETRSKQAEENLAAAEAAMRDMQTHLQSLPTTLLPPADVNPSALARRYLAATITHNEFTGFLTFIRHSKPQYLFSGQAYPPAPVISNVLSQPFLQRATLEDVDPTLRLDTAPDLGWLNRRSVQNAIVTGELAIEPVSLNTLLSSSTFSSAYPQDIGCAMCGKQVVVRAQGQQTVGALHGHEHLPPPSHPAAGVNTTPAPPTPARPQAGSRFSFKPFFASPSAPTATTSPAVSPLASPNPATSSTTFVPPQPPSPPIYIFRVNASSSTASDKEKENLGRLYPLCASGWCLARLRAACEWYRFVRTGMIDVIWRGEDGWTRPERSLPMRTRTSIGPVEEKQVSAPPSQRASIVEMPTPVESPSADAAKATADKPDLPPRKKTGWGLGFGSLGGGKGLGLSKGDTPPQSPGTESPNQFGENVEPEQVPVTSDTVGTATVEEDTERVEAGDTLATIDNDANPSEVVETSTTPAEPQVVAPEEPAATTTESEGGADKDNLAVPKPTESNANSDVEDDAHDFSTPKSSNSVLPAEAPATETANEAGKADGNPTDASIDISSPRASIDIPAAISTDGNTVLPPPPPARSAARRAVPAPPAGGSAPPPLPDRSRTRPLSSATLGAEAAALKSPILPVTPEMIASNHPITPEPPAAVSSAQTPGPGGKTANRASMVPGTSAPSKTGKRYVEGDSWEAKTWREIVRLKEDMWKARVGLVEAED